jgi:hypothetical protein
MKYGGFGEESIFSLCERYQSLKFLGGFLISFLDLSVTYIERFAVKKSKDSLFITLIMCILEVSKQKNDTSPFHKQDYLL